MMAQPTLTAGPGKRAGRELLSGVDPQTGVTIEVVADRTKVRRWLDLVASQRLLANRPRGLRHELV